MIKIIINDINWELIKGQKEANYIFPKSLEIPKSRINDLEYISISLEEEVEYDGKGECEIFVKSVEYEIAELEDKEPNTKICKYCKVEFDLGIEEHFYSTDDNYMHRRCGDKVLHFNENWWDKGFDYFNIFDMTMDGEVDEFWKLEEKE